MSLETTVPLSSRVVVFVSKHMSYTLSIFTDHNHRVAVNFVCGRSASVGLLLFSDTKKPLNLCCSWKISLVFMALRPAPTSHQGFSDS